LPDSIKDFNKAEGSKGIRVKSSAYILEGKDICCLRPGKAGGYEMSYAEESLPLPVELSGKCFDLDQHFNP
jgi:hypothetical protein